MSTFQHNKEAVKRPQQTKIKDEKVMSYHQHRKAVQYVTNWIKAIQEYNETNKKDNTVVENRNLINILLAEDFRNGEVSGREAAEIRNHLDFLLPNTYDLQKIATSCCGVATDEVLTKVKKTKVKYIEYLLWLSVNRTKGLTDNQAEEVKKIIENKEAVKRHNQTN